MKQDVFIFIGPPGAGKGSLSRLCVKNLGWIQLSTGDLCRKYIEEGSPLGKEIDFAIKSGKLVSDTLITEMVVDWLRKQDHDKPVIFDGFPRTLAQAESLEEIIKKTLPALTLHVVHFSMSDETLINRLSNRYVCQNKECQAVYSKADELLAPKSDMVCDECGGVVGRRKDDEPLAIKERLRVYHQHEQSLLDFYGKKNKKIYQFVADKPLAIVFDSFTEIAQGLV